jgi:hypothetical protein
MPDNDLLRYLIENHERGKKMRQKQKAYFRTRTKLDLEIAKEAEASYDHRATQIDNLLKQD